MTKAPDHRDDNRWWTRLSLVLFVAANFVATCGYSQEGKQAATPAPTARRIPLSLDAHPPPPPELAKLIEDGRVSFVVGGRRPSESEDARSNTTTDRYDRVFDERGAEERGGRRPTLSFDAETNFQVHLDYRSRCRWKIRWQNNQRHLIVTIRLRRLRVEPTHMVWLKHEIPANQFWDSPLVRHEFDHVRLSMMVANPESFANDVREHSTIDVVIDDDVDVDRAMVLPMVDQRVKERFAELLALIEIRYRELDRQTRHGTRPLNRESELFPMLRRTEDQVSQSSTPTNDQDAGVEDVRAGEVN